MRLSGEGIVWNDTEKRAVDAQIRQSQRDVRLGAAVTRFKAVGSADFVVIGRCEPKHHLAECEKFWSRMLSGDGIVIFHGSPRMG